MLVRQRFGVDFCGALPLRVAVAHHELTLDDVLVVLARTIDGATACATWL